MCVSIFCVELKINVIMQSPSIIDAGFQAVTTLVFVEPSIILPAIVQRIRADLDATLLEALTTEDYNMWKTPEGQLYDNGKARADSSYVFL